MNFLQDLELSNYYGHQGEITGIELIKFKKQRVVNETSKKEEEQKFQFILTCSDDKTLRIWKDNKFIKVFTDPFVQEKSQSINKPLFNENRHCLLACSSTSLLQWNFPDHQSMEVEYIKKAHRIQRDISSEDINDMKLSADCKILAIANDAKEVMIVHYDNFSVLYKLISHQSVSRNKIQIQSQICYQIQFSTYSPNLHLFSGGFDYQIMQWNFKAGIKIQSRRIQKSRCLTKQHIEFDKSCLTQDPPYPYSMAVVHTSSFDRLLVGLGNGQVLSLNQSNMDYCASFDLYNRPISNILIIQNQLNDKFLLVTAPIKNQMTISLVDQNFGKIKNSVNIKTLKRNVGYAAVDQYPQDAKNVQIYASFLGESSFSKITLQPTKRQKKNVLWLLPAQYEISRKHKLADQDFNLFYLTDQFYDSMIQNQKFSEDKLIERALAMIKQHNIDGIFSISCYPVAICAVISQLSGLPGPSLKSIFLINHKFYARKFVHESFDEHWYFGIYQNSTVEDVKSQIKEYPCLLKVCCSMHAFGQRLIKQQSDVQRVLQELNDYKQGMKHRNRFYFKYLAEKDRPEKTPQEMPLYMIQKLYSLSQNVEFFWQGVVQTIDPKEKQKFKWYSWSQTDTFKNGDNFSWVSPCRYNESSIEKLNKRFELNEVRILKEAGFNDASFDLGFFVNKQGKLHVVQNNSRLSYLGIRYDEFEGPGIDTVKHYCQICTRSKVTNMPSENKQGKPSFLTLMRVYKPGVKVDDQWDLKKIEKPGIKDFKCFTPFMGEKFRPVKFNGYLKGAHCGHVLHKANSYRQGINTILGFLQDVEISRPTKLYEDNCFDIEQRLLQDNQNLYLD